jgi:hypothetical protein
MRLPLRAVALDGGYTSLEQELSEMIVEILLNPDPDGDGA